MFIICNMKTLKITPKITEKDNNSIDKYLREVNNIPLITEDEEVELAIKIKTGDTKAFEKLVNANLRFVISVAKQYQNQGLSLSDLINEGNIGLIKAAKRFDATKGFKFISYAVWWIRQTISQALAENMRIIRLPINKIEAVKKINKTFIQLTQVYERPPSTIELAKTLSVENKYIEEIISLSKKTTSIDAPISNENNTTLTEILTTSSANSDLNSASMQIKYLMKNLSQREHKVIKMYYGINMPYKMTLEEIAEKIGLTRERIRQIKNNAILKLKKAAIKIL